MGFELLLDGVLSPAIVFVERQSSFREPIVLSNFVIALIALLVPLFSFWLGKKSEKARHSQRQTVVKAGLRTGLLHLNEQTCDLENLWKNSTTVHSGFAGRRIFIPVILDNPQLWIDHLSIEKVDELSNLLTDIKTFNRLSIELKSVRAPNASKARGQEVKQRLDMIDRTVHKLLSKSL